MDLVQVESTADFAHGRDHYLPGQSYDMPRATAEELEKAGLVVIKQTRRAMANKALPDSTGSTLGNAPAAGGAAAPSSSSRAVRPSAKKTPAPAKTGAAKTPKRGR